jgi:tRNA threonylcarbamoyladenosine biosynthesis protein TsaE
MRRHTVTATEAETELVGQQLAARLQGGSVVALDGELGAGKTCFVRGLARGLRLNPSHVSSPTFVIEHRYHALGSLSLAHIDAYRLASPADLEAIGWDELLDDQTAVIAVEWAERVRAALPAAHFKVKLSHGANGTRVIEITEP